MNVNGLLQQICTVMKKTVELLNKYGEELTPDLTELFEKAPERWNNLKTKVSLAKQRLGPTIQVLFAF